MNKKSVIAAAIFAMFAGNVMAADAAGTTLKADGVTWQVNAVKDSKHALQIEPQGTVNISYDAIGNKWSTGEAPFKITMLGQTGETVKLEAKLASVAKLTNTADSKSTLDLDVSAGSTGLAVGNYADITKDIGLGDKFGNTGAQQNAQSKLTVAVAKTTDGSVPKDGNYKGQVVADFQATWSTGASA